MNKNKVISAIIAGLALISIILFAYTRQRPFSDRDEALTKQTWTVFQEYLVAAKSHNLRHLSSLSYQLSEVCKDKAKEDECYGRMDGIYNLTKDWSMEDFPHILADQRQIVLYGDRVAIYFIKNAFSMTKVLGIRLGDMASYDIEAYRQDTDSDGWWDTTETFFYENQGESASTLLKPFGEGVALPSF